MKHIILHLKDDVFYRLNRDKLRRERHMEIKLTWEKYFEVIHEKAEK